MAEIRDVRPAPPLPTAVFLTATLRDTGFTEIAVARTRFTDVMGERFEMDFTPELAMELLLQLARFVSQVGVQGRG